MVQDLVASPALIFIRVLKILFGIIVLSLVAICFKVWNFLPEMNPRPSTSPSTSSATSRQILGGNQHRFPRVSEVRLPKGEPKFSNEEARVVGMPLGDSEHPFRANSTKLIYLATTYFGEWNPSHYYFPHLGSRTFQRYSCPVDSCEVTNDKRRLLEADAVLFHVRDVTIEKVPSRRRYDQLYILYSMEPPWLETLDFRRYEGFFNWTMSYREGSDVIVKYGMIGRRPIRSPGRVSKRRDLAAEARFRKKLRKAVWFVSNCCTDSNRELYVSQLRQYFEVDIFGGCGEESCRPAETKRCYRKVARKYMFYLAFENAICRAYVTEKLFNALEQDMIPVVLGGVDYADVAPPGSVIDATSFSSPQKLGSYMHLVSANYTLYASYFQWKNDFRSYLHPWMCDLCMKLHANPSKSVKRDLETWWNEGGSCRRWTGRQFTPADGDRFPCYNRKMGSTVLE